MCDEALTEVQAIVDVLPRTEAGLFARGSADKDSAR
jgi:hypothetical protein